MDEKSLTMRDVVQQLDRSRFEVGNKSEVLDMLLYLERKKVKQVLLF